MKKSNKVDPLAKLSAELAELKESMSTRRREDLIEDFNKLTISELRELQSYWEEEKSRRNKFRLASDTQEYQYQVAKEMVELILYVLQNYHARDAGSVTFDASAVLSVRDAAVYLGVSESVVRGKIKRGEIPYMKIDGQYKFYMVKLQEWLRTRTIITKEDTNDGSSNDRVEAIWNKVKGEK